MSQLALVPKDHGFTLIELSIVLVIIGLIIGGVLVGRDMISAAEIRAQISQIEKITSAANTFRSKYNYIPGDMPLQAHTDYGLSNVWGWGGDNNGVITDSYASSPPWTTAIENVVFGWDLGKANLIAEQIDMTHYRYVKNFPLAAINKGASFLPFSYQGYIWLYFGLTDDAPGGGWIGFNQSRAVAKAAQLFGIDQKTDDGLPSSGTVLATTTLVGTQGVMGAPTLDTTNGQCVNVSGGQATYNLTNNEILCRFIVRMP